MKKEKNLNIRLDKEQRKWLEQKAKKGRVSIGAYVRFLIEVDMTEALLQDEKRLEDLEKR